MSRRSLRRGALARYARVAALLAAAWTVLEALFVRRAYLNNTSSSASTSGSQIPSFGSDKIFITSIHWNQEYLLRTHWFTATSTLVTMLGARNVHLSVQESGSYDNTKGALREFDAWLGEAGIPRTIVLEEETHEEVINLARPATAEGWIETPKNGSKPRRIPFLAGLRNVALQPLYTLAEQGMVFDKVLFLNDVIYRPEDVHELWATNGGEYAAACALDFARPPAFYDTFALRDSDGHEALMNTWPYFRSADSRRALKANKPVPVASCWNGMVMMDAAPFYAQSKSRLKFRGIPDSLAESHLEGSECCLIHADNPLSASKGVLVNPNVRVAYNPDAWAAVETPGTHWVSMPRIVWGSWANRFLRWTTTPWFKEGANRRRVDSWRQAKSGREEPGEFCLINEMQVLLSTGWAHV